MDGVASTTPEVEAAGSEPDLSPHTGIRSIAPLLPERRVAASHTAERPTPTAKGSALHLLPPGTCVAGKYIICDVLGSGGSATVYAAEQVGLKRVVAFKLYPLGTQTSPARERFEREAELLARVQHENVVAVFDSGCLEDGSPYLVVQRLQGESLALRLARGALPIVEAIDVALQVASALEALSLAGITHRDIKPDNLVLDVLPDGRAQVKLVDFGIALQAEAEAEGARIAEGLMGTPHYMAPEQVSGAAIDPRCDQYALGATLYEMLTGRPPHQGESLSEIARAILFASITPVRKLRPDCPAALEAIIMRALAREPGERFASARALKEALERCAGGAEARPSKAQLEDTLRVPTRRPERPGRRRRLSLVLGLAAALALSLLAAGSPSAGRIAGIEQTSTTASLWSRDAALDLLLQAGPLAQALFLRTSAAAAGLLLRAQSSARAWLSLLEREGDVWELRVRGLLLDTDAIGEAQR